MSRKLVRLGGCLLVLSLALVAIRSYGDEPRPKPAVGEDDPFGSESPAPVVGEKPKPNAKPTEDLEDPFGSGDGSNPSAAKKPSAKEPAPKPAQSTKPVAAANAKPKPKSPLKLHGGEKAILKALKQQTSVDFQETPLKDVVEYLSDTHHIPIVLDAAGLKDAGVDPELPVTRRLSGISLQSALQIMLDELQLKWTIHNEVLMITSPQKAESDEYMYTKVYDVADLVIPIQDAALAFNPLTEPGSVVSDPTESPVGQPIVPTFGSTGPNPVVAVPMPGTYVWRGSVGSSRPRDAMANGADFKPLMDLIQNTVATKSWIDNGGNGTISEVPSSLSLAFSQTREVHQEVERLLADLRARQRAMPAFRVELRWLWLDSAHRNALIGSSIDHLSRRAPRSVDLNRFTQIEHQVPSIRACATFMNAQHSMLAAGDRRAVIVNAVPGANGGAGYSPIVTMPNVGVAAGVSALMQPDGKTAMLTVQSVVTRWTPKRGPVTVGAAWGPGSQVDADASQSPMSYSTTGANPTRRVLRGMGGMGIGTEGGFTQVPIEKDKTVPAATLPTVGGPAVTPTQPPAATAQNATSPTSHASISSHGAGSSSCPIDLPVMPTQEFGTTLRVPLGEPVVVGSVTFSPTGDAGLGEAKVDAMEVYLIATTSIVKSPVKKAK